MRVHTLAGARRTTVLRGWGNGVNPMLAPAAPQYRWTFTTYVKKMIKNWDSRTTSRMQDERTVTVIASTEDAAKSKIIEALPPLPRDEGYRPGLGYESATYERLWSLDGSVEEVTQ